MSDQGKANYEAYRKLAGRPGVSAAPLPEYERLPMELRYAFDAGADAVEGWLAEAPVDEDAPGNEPTREHRALESILAEIDGYTEPGPEADAIRSMALRGLGRGGPGLLCLRADEADDD